MRILFLLGSLLALGTGTFDSLLQQAFYPTLLLVFIIASLGIPIPEDLPLIAAGVILRTHPDVATWTFAVPVALTGIMTGDIVLYSAGRRWGRGIFEHRSVRWLITRKRLELMTERFHHYGVWCCFFGRFIVGVRAMMCLTAGVTRFPFWKFFLADFSGALLSAPFFMLLGYLFAGMLDQLEAYIWNAKWVLLGLLAVLGVVAWRYEVNRLRKLRIEDGELPPPAPKPAASDARRGAAPPETRAKSIRRGASPEGTAG